MKLSRRRAVSPIIAALLLIAIAVAAGIIVYVYVNSIASNLTQGGGAQTSERLQMQSYNFQFSPTGCTCAQWLLDLNLLNSGGGSTTISAVYYDGTALTLGTPVVNPGAALAGINNNYFPLPSTTIINDYGNVSCTATAGAAQTICFTSASTKTTYAAQDTGQIVITFSAGAAAGTVHTVKVVSLTGATFVFSVAAGKTG